MDVDNLKYSYVLEIIGKYDGPMPFAEIIRQVASERNIKPQLVESQVVNVLRTATFYGLLRKEGDSYSYFLNPYRGDGGPQQLIHSSDDSMDPQRLAFGKEPPPSTKPSVVEPKNVQDGGGRNMRKRSYPFNVPYKRSPPAPMTSSSIIANAASRKRKLHDAEMMDAVRENPSITSVRLSERSVRRSDTQETIGSLMRKAGFDRRNRSVRMAESLLLDAVIDAENASQRTDFEVEMQKYVKKFGEDDEQKGMPDGDSTKHDSIFYAVCGHAKNINTSAAGKPGRRQADTMTMKPGANPFITPDECPACQDLRDCGAGSNRRARSKGKKKSNKRKKSASKKRRR